MTKNRVLVLMGAFFLAGAAMANDAPPSDDSIRELFKLTDAQNLIRGLKPQIDAMMKAAMDDAARQRSPTPDQQQVLDRMRGKMSTVVEETINWDALEPIYIRTYQTAFTQDELDGLVAFYKSPAGQALIVKMPLVVQTMMQEMRIQMKAMQQKFAVIQADTTREMQALAAK